MVMTHTRIFKIRTQSTACACLHTFPRAHWWVECCIPNSSSSGFDSLTCEEIDMVFQNTCTQHTSKNWDRISVESGEDDSEKQNNSLLFVSLDMYFLCYSIMFRVIYLICIHFQESDFKLKYEISHLHLRRVDMMPRGEIAWLQFSISNVFSIGGKLHSCHVRKPPSQRAKNTDGNGKEQEIKIFFILFSMCTVLAVDFQCQIKSHHKQRSERVIETKRNEMAGSGSVRRSNSSAESEIEND